MCWTSHTLLFGEHWVLIREPLWVAGFTGASTDRPSIAYSPHSAAPPLHKRLTGATVRRLVDSSSATDDFPSSLPPECASRSSSQGEIGRCVLQLSLVWSCSARAAHLRAALLTI